MIVMLNCLYLDFGKEEEMSNRYQMREDLISIGDDFWIENENGERVFRVDGKVLRISKTYVFLDMAGNTLCRIKERLLTIKDTMEIEDAEGKDMAVVRKALISPLRDRWNVKIRNGPDLDVQGNILDHEYAIRQGRRTIAEVSKKWFRLTDTYGVEIAEEQNDILILAIAVAMDAMTHERG
jgi:uncharacterized protein YxjI